MRPLARRGREYWKRLAQAGRRLRREHRPLRTRAMRSVTSDQRSAAEAVRWLGEIELGADRRHALLCHPSSAVTYALRVRPGDVVGAGCALLPDAWSKNAGGAEFSLTIGDAAGESSIARARVVDPGRRRRDRRWRRLAVRVPFSSETAAIVSLATRLRPGARPDFAWAVWGEPAIERPRPIGEVLAALGVAMRALPRGPRAAFRAFVSATLADYPTAAYRRWASDRAPDPAALAHMRAESGRWPNGPLISVITPVYNTDPRWLRACVESVRAQAYVNWELCLADDGSTAEGTRAVLGEQTDPRIRIVRLERNAGISAASNAALAMARGEFVALLDHDDELTPDALYQAVRHLIAVPDADVLYSDEDKRDADGGLSEPFFKPCWSPEHLLSAMYTCHLTVARRTLVERAGGFRVGYEGAQDHDLMLRLSELTTRIDHIPRVLYHWRRTPESTASAGSTKPWAHDSGKRALEDYARRNGIQAEVLSGGVPGLYRMKFAIAGQPLVTLVLVAENESSADPDRAAAALRARTAYPYVSIVAAVAPAASLTSRVNAAIRAADGAQVVVVDAALEPVDEEWLTALLEYSQQQAIGAVGAKIQYPDGRLRHIGMVTCAAGGPAPILHGYPADSYGYFSSAIGVRNYSAVSGECLMTRRDVFDRLRGFDEGLPWRGADVDYCIRARQLGLRIVFTPYARLVCASRMPPRPAAAACDDPYYNLNLSRASADYLLDE
ncbi:MAG: hypothetical protein A3G21_23740 [Acidobacteria bacterium RIFCSPLOWO2_12_FULL_66_21]|nr:MAG: hypothetical protein A3G21_23740 [Acidobacteria bacterium RIFCSPLOWO2_12_FULL_66_21]